MARFDPVAQGKKALIGTPINDSCPLPACVWCELFCSREPKAVRTFRRQEQKQQPIRPTQLCLTTWLSAILFFVLTSFFQILKDS